MVPCILNARLPRRRELWCVGSLLGVLQNGPMPMALRMSNGSGLSGWMVDYSC